MVTEPISNPEPRIKISHLTKSFPADTPRGRALEPDDVKVGPRLTVFEDFSLEVAAGEFVVILGLSGCGKTTLLKLMGGLLAPDSGQVLINGEQITGPTHLTITVFQDFTLLPWRTVFENTQLPLEAGSWKTQSSAERRTRANDALRKVGLYERRHAYPAALSGGMQQRLALARGLVVQTAVLLMDEAFGSLDLKTRQKLREVLLRIWQETQPRQTIVAVTHDVQEAIELADRIVVLGGLPARIVWDYRMPEDRERNREYVTTSQGQRLQKEIVRKLYGSQDRAIVKGRSIYIPTSMAQRTNSG